MDSNERHGRVMPERTPDEFSVAAVQLVEAACSAQAGDCETAKIHIANALAVIHGRARREQLPARLLTGPAQPTAPGSLAEWQAQRLLAHIDAGLSGRIPVKDLAVLLGFSIGHFCRVFKCTFGMSAHTYIMQRRIELAKGLMLTTRDSLCEIALSCGMGDQSHFTRTFRRAVGETPYVWRRNRRGALKIAKR